MISHVWPYRWIRSRRTLPATTCSTTRSGSCRAGSPTRCLRHLLSGWPSCASTGDMYDSTMVALQSLYPKLSVGGYVIIDDYHAVRGCKEAVDDFRAEHAITDELRSVDWSCRYWRRAGR